ncbi:MAG: 16S rRNA (guanine(966)-N(2))-methyltransferase RsmD [Thermoleophilaceae bacterium]|nr:16S rRNA (guanine(966)-N(2))-methyltransferase RsmD [Thermoleophilaceae bacterium]
MRVVAGAYKGRLLSAPPGTDTRPTSDRVRESLFQILGPLEGLRALDLYAGSGALGIEALSRGAASAEFVEEDPRAAAAIRANLEAIGVEARVHRRDAIGYLRAGASEFDLVFCDPPYACASRLGPELSRLLPPEPLIVTESDKRAPLLLDLPLVDERAYGSTRIAFYRGGG